MLVSCTETYDGSHSKTELNGFFKSRKIAVIAVKKKEPRAVVPLFHLQFSFTRYSLLADHSLCDTPPKNMTGGHESAIFPSRARCMFKHRLETLRWANKTSSGTSGANGASGRPPRHTAIQSHEYAIYITERRPENPMAT